MLESLILQCIFILSLDDTGENTRKLEMQHLGMRMFLGLTKYTELQERFRSATFGGGAFDVCSWRGVLCNKQKIIRTIYMTKIIQIHFNIDWIPATLNRLDIEHSRFGNGALHTRRLPKRLSYCRLSDCGLHNTLDLRTLPEYLQTLDLVNNQFYGTVYLLNLPQTMKRLDVRFNMIDKVIAINSLLPESLESCSFYRSKTRPRFVSLDEKMMDPRVM